MCGGNLTGQVYHQSGYTIVLKQDSKAAKFFGELVIDLKSLQDADAQAADILVAYFNNCQRNVME